MSSDKDFKWTDELIFEFIFKEPKDRKIAYDIVKKDMEDFKESKAIKEQPIVVYCINTNHYPIPLHIKKSSPGWSNNIATTAEIPKEKYDQIKQVIEKVLNQPTQNPAPLNKDNEQNKFGDGALTIPENLYPGNTDAKVKSSFATPKDKEYEIESYRNKFTKEITKRPFVFSLPDLYYEIYSVKILSDNNIFSVRDKVSSSFDKDWEIKGFEMADSKLFVLRKVVLNNGKHKIWRNCELKDLITKTNEQIKQPLFTEGMDLSSCFFNKVEGFKNNEPICSDWYFIYDDYGITVSKDIPADTLMLVLKAIKKITSDRKYTEKDIVLFLTKMNPPAFLQSWINEWDTFKQSLSNTK
jgi:hypothetical protein